MKLCCVILGAVLIELSSLEMDVHWTSLQAEFQQGDEVRLKCSGTKCKDKTRKLWRGGNPYNILCTETKSRLPEKYEFQPEADGSVLKIKNISMTDLNCNYTCNCGFFQFTEELSSKHFLYPPDALPIHNSISKRDNEYHIAVSISKVYPKPSSCHRTLLTQDKNITDSLEATESESDDSYYKVRVNTVIECSNNYSTIDAKIVCVVKHKEFDVFGTTVYCHQDAIRYNINLTSFIAAGCSALVVVLILGITFRSLKKQMQQNRRNELEDNRHAVEIEMVNLYQKH